MKIQISNLQFTLLIANYITASSLLILPQALIDLGLQNTWIVPFFLFLFSLLLILIGFHGLKYLKYNEFFLMPGKRKRWSEKGLALLLLLFSFFILIRDLRALTDFIGITLLQHTPDAVITFIILLAIFYLVWLGLEVITRFNDIYFTILSLTVCVLPVLLLNEIDLAKFKPILTMDSIPSIMQSSFIGLSWIGEFVLLLLIAGGVKPLKDVKRSAIWGVIIGLFLTLIMLSSIIAVLGATLSKYTIYPSHILVRQINITDFLDRLDLVIISFWMPTLFGKMALTFYGIQRSLNILFNKDTKMILIPLSAILGLFSFMMFENITNHLYFSIYIWATLGLFLELLIVIFFQITIRQQKVFYKKE